jgi:hypothetical protein
MGRTWQGGVILGAAVLAVLAALAGCAPGPRLFVNREADPAYYRKVAVLPFASLSNDPLAGGRVTRAFVTELVIADRFRIVDPAEFLAELDRLGALPDPQGNVDPEKLKRAAQKVEATGLIRGAVTEYTMQRSGSEEVPVLSFDAEMLDVATSNVVWRVSVSKKGRGRLSLLGIPGARTYGRVTQEACREAVAQLERRAF